MFFSIDGCDGAGKSTQVSLLAKWLREAGWTVTLCRDPGGTALGERLREIVLRGWELSIGARAEMLLYMASRAQLVEEVIRPALDAGHIVISDRFLLSNIVYQGYGFGNAGGDTVGAVALSPESIWQVGMTATGGVLPDLGIVLDLPIEESLRRLRETGKTPDRLESRGEEFFERLRNGFRTEAEKSTNDYRLVDATPCVAEIHAMVRAIVQPMLDGEMRRQCDEGQR